MTRNALFQHRREGKIDWGPCSERNPRGKKASWRPRGSGSARAGWYKESWEHQINKQRVQKDITGVTGCYGRPSKWSCKFDDGEDGEDEDDEETEQGLLSKDDEPGWVKGTITKTVQQWIQRFRPKRMMPDELIQPGWKYVAGDIHEREMKYGTSDLAVPAFIRQ